MHRRLPVRLLLCVGVAACQAPTPEAGSQSEDEVVATIFQATLGEANARVPRVAGVSRQTGSDHFQPGPSFRLRQRCGVRPYTGNRST